MSHGDKVTALPPGFSVIASNAATPIAGMADEARRFYAVQFHPEVTHTHQGKAMLGRFVHDICGCGRTGTCRITSARRWKKSARRSARTK